MRIISVLFTLFVAFPAFCDWHLENELSSLSFVTIKKADVGEVHEFTELSGNINKQGQVEFSVNLSSVNTNIDIRNERMKKYLFNIGMFPKALFSAQLDQAALKAIKTGSSALMKLAGTIDLHGQKQAVTTKVLVAKLSDKQLVVSSMQPILIKAKDFKLIDGISKLRELAHLPSISNVVPVSFVLTFIQ